jgi:hypothetical protein
MTIRGSPDSIFRPITIQQLIMIVKTLWGPAAIGHLISPFQEISWAL